MKSKPMPQHDFIIGPVDTDSISFCKADMSPFTDQELIDLLKEINDISPEFISFEDDGYYKACIALKAKNYILWNGLKKVIKGAAFKSSKLEPALKEMMQKLVDAMLEDQMDQLVPIYQSYVDEVMNLQDISRWAKKVSASESVLNCDGVEERTVTVTNEKGVEREKTVYYKNGRATDIRSNEVVVWDAIKMEELVQVGEKFYLYPNKWVQEVQTSTTKKGKVKEKIIYGKGLKQTKAWEKENPDHDKQKLLQRVYATVRIFKTILDIEQFMNYSLVKNYKALGEDGGEESTET